MITLGSALSEPDTSVQTVSDKNLVGGSVNHTEMLPQGSTLVSLKERKKESTY